MGIGIRSEEVEYAASVLGCSMFSPPFVHLEVKVGGAMTRINSWDEVISKVSSRLSKWKLKILSVGEASHNVGLASCFSEIAKLLSISIADGRHCVGMKLKVSIETMDFEHFKRIVPPGLLMTLKRKKLNEDDGDSNNSNLKENVDESASFGRFKKSVAPSSGGSVMGVWLLNGIDLMIIAVYAPHDPRDKRMLWGLLGACYYHGIESCDYGTSMSSSQIRQNGKKMEVLAALCNIDHIHSMYLAQKGKIEMSSEGDENSNFSTIDSLSLRESANIDMNFRKHYFPKIKMELNLESNDEMALKHQYRRLYALESSKQINVAEQMSHTSLVFSYRRVPKGGVEEEHQCLLQSRIDCILLPQMLDHWVWSLKASGEFSVKSVRYLIDDLLLPKEDFPTRWVNVIPIKINVFAWRVRSDKLPKVESLRGVDLSSILCRCNISVESSAHLFCLLACQLKSKVIRWWELEDLDIDSYDGWLLWFKNIHFQ
ncbi:hypothetical protein Tco_1235685 [Tanacetum coccineum]